MNIHAGRCYVKYENSEGGWCFFWSSTSLHIYASISALISDGDAHGVCLSVKHRANIYSGGVLVSLAEAGRIGTGRRITNPLLCQ